MSSPTTPPWPSLYNPGLELNHIPHTAAVQPGGAYLYHAVDVFRFTLYWTLIFYTPIFLLCGFFAFWNLSCPPPPPRPSRMTTSTTTSVHLTEGPRSSTHPSRPRTHSRNDDTWFSRNTDSSYYTLYPLPRTPLQQQQQQPEPSLPPPGSSMQAIPSTSTSFPTPFPSTAPILPSHSSSTGAYTGLSRQQHPSSMNNNLIKQGAAALSVSSSSSGPPRRPIIPPSPQPTRTKPPKYKFKHHERRSRFTFALIVLLTFLAASLAGAVLSSAILGFVVAAFYRSVDYNMSTWIPFLLAVIKVSVGFLSLWPSLIDVI